MIKKILNYKVSFWLAVVIILIAALFSMLIPISISREIDRELSEQEKVFLD